MRLITAVALCALVPAAAVADTKTVVKTTTNVIVSGEHELIFMDKRTPEEKQASVAAASRFRYFAAESNAARTPVFTSNTFTFRNSDASQSREEIKAVCDEKTRQLVQSMGQQ